MTKTKTKLTKKWTKGADFMDNSPRYSFDGRDPSYTCERLRVVIYQERVRPYPRFPKEKRYLVSVYDQQRECEYSDMSRLFKYLLEAKKYAEELFSEAEAETDGDDWSDGGSKQW